MSPKLEKNQSPILVKFLMIHNNSPKNNHQNWWNFLVQKISLNLEQNYSQNKVKILVIQRICLQKCHQNWWKSDGITKICANFVENQDGLIYGLTTGADPTGLFSFYQKEMRGIEIRFLITIKTTTKKKNIFRSSLSIGNWLRCISF